MAEDNHLQLQPELQKEDASYLEKELHLSLEEVARLHNALALANMKLATYQSEENASLNAQFSNQDLLSEFFAELNPLTKTIQYYSNLLANQTVGSLGPIQIRFIERIERSLKQIDHLIEDFQKITGVPQGSIDLETTHFSLASLIQKVIDLSESVIESKQITIQMDLPDSLDEVFGDSEVILNILDQVLGNALSVTPNQGMISIKLVEENPANMLIINIHDEGPVLSEKDLQKLFVIKNDQKIPGSTFTFAQVYTMNQLILDQGGALSIVASSAPGNDVKISFLKFSQIQRSALD